MSSFSQQVKQLFQEQLVEWPFPATNYKALEGVKTRSFEFANFNINVQFNPARIISSAAKIDPKTIKERKCFLCSANLPPEQRGLPFGDKYTILVNPFPIFPLHLTIPDVQHVDQLIYDRFSDMLDLAEALNDFVVFYNGPKCGASAPDHMHFQAGNKGFLPIEKDVLKVDRDVLVTQDDLVCYSLENYFRKVIVVEAIDKNAAVKMLENIYKQLPIKEDETEPMMNIIAWHDGAKWFTCIYPREVHRPSCFYAEGEDKYLITPGSVELGGNFITPREEDFNKIHAEVIEAILKEVSLSDEQMAEVKAKITP